MTQRSPTKKEIMEWLQANNHSPEDISDDTTEFRFRIKRGPIAMIIVRHSNKDHIAAHARFMLPAEHEKRYTPKRDSKFKGAVIEKYPTLNIDIQFQPGSPFVVYDRIFDDGFSYDRLSIAMRNVTLAGISLHKLLFSAVGLDTIPRLSESEKPSPTYYS